MKWNDLSMAERAKYIQLGVINGITNLGTIKDTYNKYVTGGDLGGEDNKEEVLYYNHKGQPITRSLIDSGRHRPAPIRASKRPKPKITQEQLAKQKAQGDKIDRQLNLVQASLDAQSDLAKTKIDGETLAKNLEEKRQDWLDSNVRPLGKMAQAMEVAASLYTLGAGTNKLLHLLSGTRTPAERALTRAINSNLGKKVDNILSSDIGWKTAQVTGAVADGIQIGTGVAEKNRGAVIENSMETGVNTLGLVGYSDVLRRLPGTYARIGSILDTGFDHSPYVVSTYDLLKDKLFPSIETMLNK